MRLVTETRNKWNKQNKRNNGAPLHTVPPTIVLFVKSMKFSAVFNKLMSVQPGRQLRESQGKSSSMLPKAYEQQMHVEVV